MLETIKIWNGGKVSDNRGSLKFINDFDFKNIRRFYQITHDDMWVIRAWQGHKLEYKYFYVSFGKFIIAWVPIDNWESPSINLKPSYNIFNSEEPQILAVPPGYANGFKALTKGSIITIYSNFDLIQSENDRWSFSSSLWLDWAQF